MPLHADDGSVDRLDGLDRAVGGLRADLEALREAIHALVVRRRDNQLGVGKDGGQGALEVRSFADAHTVADEAVIRQDPVVRVGAVGALDVLLERAAQRRVDDLHAAANAQERGARAHGVVDQGNLSAVSAVPVASLALVALGGAVQAGVDVLAAHDDDRVGVLGAQGGTLGTVFLCVLADNVPVRQRGLKKTIPQAHADVVVCLVPRACRQDVGNQQRRLRVVRHGPYHCSLEATAPGAFTGWPIVTARVRPPNSLSTPLPHARRGRGGSVRSRPAAPASSIGGQFSFAKRSTRASSSAFSSSVIHAISMELRAMRSRSARPRLKRWASAR